MKTKDIVVGEEYVFDRQPRTSYGYLDKYRVEVVEKGLPREVGTYSFDRRTYNNGVRVRVISREDGIEVRENALGGVDAVHDPIHIVELWSEFAERKAQLEASAKRQENAEQEAKERSAAALDELDAWLIEHGLGAFEGGSWRGAEVEIRTPRGDEEPGIDFAPKHDTPARALLAKGGDVNIDVKHLMILLGIEGFTTADDILRAAEHDG